ncbi:MAG TPA: alpha-L-rhamnosidase C-terminal domain-containing protein [Edaphobacter sp.]|nr:alpha-L-rhamnosidase C-terminal domain-containing protein [Edaphobacter sp.]
MKTRSNAWLAGGILALSMGATVTAQNKQFSPKPLDPAYDISPPVLESSIHKPLPEEYIWTAADPAVPGSEILYARPGMMDATEPHYFRDQFSVSSVPAAATLYLAGPRSVKVWLNGQSAGERTSDLSSPLGMHVFAFPVEKYLHPGKNTIAIEAVRGKGVNAFVNSALVRQQTFGQVLAAKILPLRMWEYRSDASPLLLSNAQWKSAMAVANGWQNTNFDDAAWKPVQSIGGIESSVDFLQWNADAGLYNWPGYDGISPYLAHLKLSAQKILTHYAGRGQLQNLDALTETGSEFEVKLPAPLVANAEAPAVFLDFGKEINGRVEIVSDSDSPAIVTIQMGESEPEALHVPYLGTVQLTVPAHGTAYGPKSAFRYAKLRFIGGGKDLRFKHIGVDDIYYPVKYEGSFESSDPMLNRIWETGAYTAHLCMQDGIWDAPKRDRGRWMGDTDVSGRVIEAVFGDRPLMEDTLDRLIGPAPVNQHVNGIPGYSSFWFTEVADYYRHTGSKQFLEREHARMVQLLNYVDSEFDARGIYANTRKQWLFVDWSPDLNGDTPETRRATTLEFYRAYHEAAWLLRELGDTANADKYEARAVKIKSAAQKYLVNPQTGAYGPRWQSNAMAVFSGAASPAQYNAIWDHVLSNVGHVKYNALIITPYYNYYVIRAMADMGHRKDALEWIRQYWGGMIQEGATSFWEGYDPSWYKGDFHASLQADNGSGYFVSLAHGWSSGPTVWLMEEVLGIQPTGPGFSTVNIRPDLVDLSWAKGGEPTPHGTLKVDARKDGATTSVTIDLPPNVTAKVSVPVNTSSATVLMNGTVQQATSAENGTRKIVTLNKAGHYALTSR